jgi:hypothetical protein
VADQPPIPETTPQPKASHRFLDEAGDTVILGKGGVPVCGQPGVSLAFGIGMVKFGTELAPTRQRIGEMEREIERDAYLNRIPSIAKQIAAGGFHLHAKDDPPEVREKFYRLIRDTDCSLEMMVARKIPGLFVRKHGARESEFYADVLSHLLKNKLKLGEKLVLNVAARGNSTKNTNLELALHKATARFLKLHDVGEIRSQVVFNLQTPKTEPLLKIADYLCWTVQRVFERGETRYYDFMLDKIRLVVDLYDSDRYAGGKNYYKRDNPLTAKNKLSPPSP